MDDPLPDDTFEITAFSPTIEQNIDEHEDTTVAAPSRQSDTFADSNSGNAINAASIVKPILDNAISDLADTVEILKYLQLNMDGIPEGETNYIIVDREDVLKSTFDELPYIVNPRNTFQVDFMGGRITFDSSIRSLLLIF